MKLDGFTANVLCGGKILDEHSANEETATANCFVASEAGKEIHISLGNVSATSNVLVKAYIDGQYIMRKVVKAGKSSTVMEFRIDADTKQALVFANIEVTDDDSLVGPDAHGVGLIKLRVFRVLSRRRISHSPTYHSRTFRELGLIHEQTKKAGTHCVARGERVTRSMSRPRHMSTREDMPFANFLSQYRPLEMLQAQGIVPLPVRTNNKKTADKILSSQGKKRRRAPLSSPREKRARLQPAAKMAGSLPTAVPHAGQSSPVIEYEDVKPDVHGVMAVNALEAQIDMMQETVKTMRRKIDAMQAINDSGPSTKREASPITMRCCSSGDVIDLTDD
ncbi:hypothetical protein B0H21DRAFT_741625 [Amylocystis lapponica]|nr:hypothetical protein B0H21DRAFT_741625 [Amylocystis lapponica]